MKLITFTVPCYNSAAYMAKCVDSLLTAGEDAQILLIDDGSTDATPAIADAYEAAHPNIVRAIHQPNGGHGAGVNAGLANAEGLYFKVVDSDDWLDEGALSRVLALLRETRDDPLDILFNDFVFEHVEEGTRRAMRYGNVFPANRRFGWNDMGRQFASQYLMMHAMIFRTQLLRDCGLRLPEHTFYVDHIIVYQPLPYAKTLYYMHEELYRYLIGRADQSVNEAVMVKRSAQQLRVNRILFSLYDSQYLKTLPHPLKRCMVGMLTNVLCVTTIVFLLADTPESLAEKDAVWRDLHDTDRVLYHWIRRRVMGAAANIPSAYGRKVTLMLYKLARKISRFD